MSLSRKGSRRLQFKYKRSKWVPKYARPPGLGSEVSTVVELESEGTTFGGVGRHERGSLGVSSSLPETPGTPAVSVRHFRGPRDAVVDVL